MGELTALAERALADLGASTADLPAAESQDDQVTPATGDPTGAHAEFVRSLGVTPEQQRRRALGKLREAERLLERRRERLKHAPDSPLRRGLSPRDRAELNVEAAEAEVDRWREAAGLDSGGAYFPSDHAGETGGYQCDGCGRPMRDARAYARGFGQCPACELFHPDNLTTSTERSHL